jgi:WD40 repeat protein
VKVWDAQTGQEMLTLKGHTNWVYRMAFSPYGKRLASDAANATVKIWTPRRCRRNVDHNGTDAANRCE